MKPWASTVISADAERDIDEYAITKINSETIVSEPETAILDPETIVSGSETMVWGPEKIVSGLKASPFRVPKQRFGHRNNCF